MSASEPALTPESTLRQVRLIWAAMIVGILTFFGISLGMTLSRSQPITINRSLSRAMFYGVMVAFVVLPTVGLALRLKTYKRGYVDRAVTPQAYMKGNIIVFAMLETIAILASLVLLLTGIVAQTAFVVVLSVMLMILNWPNGHPMHPAEPELLRR